MIFSPALCSVAQSRLTLCDPMDCSPLGPCPWYFPSKSTGVGCHFLLQGIFPTLGLNLRLLRWMVSPALDTVLDDGLKFG